MSLQATTSEEMYSEGLSQDGLFGSETMMRVNNRIFAMLVNGNMVVKLPQDRREAMVAAGDGIHFDPGHGRPMTGWLELTSKSKETWMAIAHEAKAFVGSEYQPILG